MLIPIIVFIIAIVVHELAHGYVAYLLGDTTARDAGRLTFNPFAHADPVGTVILPLLLVAMRSPVVFGWAKPVPVNPYNFRNPKEGMLLTSLAGPAANFILAAVFAVPFKMGLFPPYSVPWTFLLTGVIISLVLGVFNLIPVPPLDGANIIASILPDELAKRFMRLQRYGFIILIALLYLGLFDKVILPLVGALTRMLVG
ncbi:MAG: site-2 protease family protein [Candidatus Makaraimicrobium thalassicum]|nr:MAG: site-2 protease family protein [Candidatus Omnitrophota bacterium]